MIYEPSPHPAPPVSLVFLAFASSNPIPKASPPATLSRDYLAIAGSLERQHRPRQDACLQGVGEVLAAFTPGSRLGAGSRRLSATRLGGPGRPWPERRGGRAGRATPETAGLPGGSLTLKVTRRRETTGPRQN